MLAAQVLGLPSMLGVHGLWPLYVLLAALPTVPLVMFRGWLLESPRWLLQKAQKDATQVSVAKTTLAQLRGKAGDENGVDQELNFMIGGIAGGTGPRTSASNGGPCGDLGLTIC